MAHFGIVSIDAYGQLVTVGYEEGSSISVDIINTSIDYKEYIKRVNTMIFADEFRDDRKQGE